MSKKRKKGFKKQFKNFEQFGKKIETIEGYVPEIFAKIARKAGIKFVNAAKKMTDEEKLVDTGSYKRNWTADIGVIGKGAAFVVKCFNSMQYASFLEYGHKTRSGGRVQGRFVGTQSLKKAEEYAVNEIDKEFGILFKKK